MTALGVNVSVAILIGWVVFALTGLVLPDWSAAVFSLVMAGLSVTLLRRSIVIGAVVALLSPFGVMLPALALRDLAMRFGLDLPGFSATELVVFLLLYTGFLAAAFGKLPVDLYRLGYAPWPVAAMTLILCAYSFLTGNWFLALVVVIGQAFWTLKWGSSNWFDHMLHVLLWPVALVALLMHLF